MLRAKYRTWNRHNTPAYTWEDAWLLSFDHANERCVLAITPHDGNGMELKHVKLHEVRVYPRTEIPLFDKGAT